MIFGVIVFHVDMLFFLSGKPQQDYQLDDYGDDYDDYEGDEAGDTLSPAEVAFAMELALRYQCRAHTEDPYISSVVTSQRRLAE